MEYINNPEVIAEYAEAFFESLFEDAGNEEEYVNILLTVLGAFDLMRCMTNEEWEFVKTWLITGANEYYKANVNVE